MYSIVFGKFPTINKADDQITIKVIFLLASKLADVLFLCCSDIVIGGDVFRQLAEIVKIRFN